MDALTFSTLALVFVALLAVGAPVAIAMGLATLAALLAFTAPEPAFTTAAQRVAAGVDSFPLLAIPFFILAGQAMNRGGIARRMIDLAAALVGWLPGGLAVVNVVAAMLFGSLSGSAVAAASGIGGTLGPRMAREGFDPRLVAAVNVSAATTGLVIPPSNILIVYSLASGGVSIAALFAAGYVPGVLTGLALAGVVIAMAATGRAGEGGRARVRISLRDLPRRTLDALPGLGLIVVVIGGILAGIFTATEAAAIAVVYAVALGLAYRELRVRELPALFRESASMTAVVLLLVATSHGFSWVLSVADAPQAISAALLGLADKPVAVLLVMAGVLLVVGTFMDMTPAVLIFTPIFLPAAVELGIDPIHFGIVMVMTLCTPPVGTVLFVGCGVARVRVESVVPKLLPFYGAMIAALALVLIFPQLALWLPRTLGLLD